MSDHSNYSALAPVASDLVTAAVAKEAGITVYLMEELTDARLRCEQLKKFVSQAVRLIAQSPQRDHLYEIAGDTIYGIPDSLFKLDKALAATALAASRLDYEELKSQLKPEKVEELEDVLRNVRLRQIDRRSPFIQPRPENAQPKMAGELGIRDINEITTNLEHILVEVSRLKDSLPPPLQGKAKDIQGLANRALKKIKHASSRPMTTARYVARDPHWLDARYPGKAQDGTPFKAGDRVLYFPNTKTFLVGPKAEAAWRRFNSEVADEAVYNFSASSNQQGKRASMFRAASTSHIATALRRIADEVQAARIPPEVARLRLHRVLMAMSQTAQQAIEAMGPIQANSREEVMKGFKSANPSLTDAQLEEIADHWEKNKDVVKDKHK
jgi:hypothetical protein